MSERMTQDPQIDDLPSQDVDARDAEQVRGGLNPQPLPPRYFVPIYQPPVLNPLPVLVRW